MWLVLAGANDHAALWAYQGLEARGLVPIEFVSAESLVHSRRWEHRLGSLGVFTRTTLPEQRVLAHANILGVLNRLSYLPAAATNVGRESDRDYAIQEFYALIVSWLYALPEPVLNGPTTRGLSGAWRHTSEWFQLAARAGLPTPRYQLRSRSMVDDLNEPLSLVPKTVPVQTLIVVAEHVVGVAPRTIRQGCRKLAELAETPLLGIEFTVDSDTWTFTGATTLPNLQLGGEGILDAIASVLRNRCKVQA